MTHAVITAAPASLSLLTDLKNFRFAAKGEGVPMLHLMPPPHTAQLPLLLTSTLVSPLLLTSYMVGAFATIDLTV